MVVGSNCAAAAGERATRTCRSLKLGWTDPDSGERLELALDGGSALARELVRDGFALLEGGTPAAGRDGRPIHVRAALHPAPVQGGGARRR